MTVIRVEPGSVRSYGTDAQAKFNDIRRELETLVQKCVDVHYFGENARQFKQTTGQMAADLANQLVQKMGQIADAVKTATTNIAQSLGGQPITISVAGTAVSVPSIPTVDFVDVDTSAMSGLIGDLSPNFSAIGTAFDEHLSRLRSTDWTGNAKEQAVSMVSAFTTSAKQSVADAQQKITQYVNDQVATATRSDTMG